MTKKNTNESWYQHTKNQFDYHPKFGGEESCDLVILGGGETGLSAALHMAESGYKVLLLEQNQIGWGASGRNGGQFITGFSCSLEKMISLVGAEDAKKLFWLSIDSIKLLKKMVAKYKINCDLVEGYYHAALRESQLRELERELQLQRKFGYDTATQIIDREKVSDHIATDQYIGLSYNTDSGHLHPLNLTLGLAKAAVEQGVKIYENSKITDFKATKRAVTITTEGGGIIKAKYFIIAGNAYLEGVSRLIEKKIMPVGTYIAATEQLLPKLAHSLIPKNAAVADLNFVLDYFRRSFDNRMLYGGRVSYSLIPPPDLKHSLQQRMLKVFPQLKGKKMDFGWGGNVAITMNRAPYFGRIGENILFAAGFSGHGVALTLLAGKLMAEVITGSQEKFNLFEKIPHLSFPGGRFFRTPSLVLGMNYYRLKDMFGF